MNTKKSTERMPIPLSITSGKKNTRPFAGTSPYKVQWESSALKPVDSNSLIFNMKQELSTIKLDVERLICNNNTASASSGSASTVASVPISSINLTTSNNNNFQKIEIMNQALRDELTNQKQVEEGLKQEIRSLKNKLVELKTNYDLELASLTKSQRETVQAQKNAASRDETRFNKICKQLEKAVAERVRLEGQAKDLTGKLEVANTEIRRLKEIIEEKTDSMKESEQSLQKKLKEKELQYQGLMAQFKKLEVSFNQKAETNKSIFKEKIKTIQEQTGRLLHANEQLTNENRQYLRKFQALKQQLEEEKRQSQQIASRLRDMDKYIEREIQCERNRCHVLERQVESLKRELEEKNEMGDVLNLSKISPTEPEDHQQLHKLRLHIMDLEFHINDLQAQIHGLSEQLAGEKEYSAQKDTYIVELERRTSLVQNVDNNVVAELEAKCQQMTYEYQHAVENYEIAIMRLENEIQEIKERDQKEDIFAASASIVLNESNAGSTTNRTVLNFDSALKTQLSENDELKHMVRVKCEEVLKIRSVADEWKNKYDTLKSQHQMDKLRYMSDEKNMRDNFQILIQNLRSEVESGKRKLESLQSKLDIKNGELKKKDEFVQQVIVGRVGKVENQSELEYLKKQLEKFFSVNYENNLNTAYSRIKQLENQLGV